MTAKFVVVSPNTSIVFTYTSLTAKVQSIATAAAHYFWDRGRGNHGTVGVPILFESLSNQQKLNIIDESIMNMVTYAAKEYYIDTASNVAQEIANEATTTAMADAELNLSL